MAKYNLSDMEYEIMEAIWQCGKKLSFSEIMGIVESNGHQWKKQTVQTFLGRLTEKGVLKSDKIGLRRFYYPVTTKEQYIANWTHDFVNENYEGSIGKFLVAFTGGKALSTEEADELHKFLQE